MVDIVRKNLFVGTVFSKDARESEHPPIGYVASEINQERRQSPSARPLRLTPPPRAVAANDVESFGAFVEVHVANLHRGMRNGATARVCTTGREGKIKEFNRDSQTL